MGTVLMDILKSTDKNEIDDYILTKKDEMKKTNFIDIQELEVKGMSKYLFKNQALGEFQKGTPTMG